MKISKEITVGLLAVVAIATFYFGFNFLKGKDFFSTEGKFYAVYDDVQGLIPANPVVLNGVGVGRVAEVRLMPNQGNKILVVMDIRDDLPLGKGTEAVLTSDLLGSMAIVLDIKNADQPLAGGDTLASRVELGLTDQFQATLQPVVDQLQTTVEEVNLFLTTINDNKGAIDSIFSSLKETGRNLETITYQNQAQLSDAIAGINQTLKSINDPKNGVGPLLTKLNAAGDSINALELAKTLESINSTVMGLDSVIAKANEGDGTLAKLLNDSTLYHNLNRLTADIDSLVVDLNENPEEYVQFSVFGRKKKK